MTIAKIVAAVAVAAFTATAAFAQTAPTTTPAAPKAPVVSTAPPATTMTTAPKAGQKKATTPEGQACSAEADAKSLHGKDRQKFRNKCIKDMKAKAGAMAPKKS